MTTEPRNSIELSLNAVEGEEVRTSTGVYRFTDGLWGFYDEPVSAGAPDPRMSLTVADMVLHKRESHTPYGIKYDEGKLEYHLVPPECLAELVKVLMFGKKKYSEDNWKKGFDFTRLHNSVLRHMEAVRMAEARDPETHFSHYAHAMCGVMFLLWYALQDEKHGKAEAPKSP